MYSMYRGSQQRCFLEIGKKIFTVFTEKYLCRSRFYIIFSGFDPAALLKKRLRHGCFSVNVAKNFFPIFKKHLC